MDKFLEKYRMLKFTQEEIDHLNGRLLKLNNFERDRYYCPLFYRWGNKLRGKVCCSSSCHWKIAEPGFTPRSSASWSSALSNIPCCLCRLQLLIYEEIVPAYFIPLTPLDPTPSFLQHCVYVFIRYSLSLEFTFWFVLGVGGDIFHQLALGPTWGEKRLKCCCWYTVLKCEVCSFNFL